MGYKSGDWRTPGQLPPKVAAFMQFVQANPQIQAITADPRYAGNTPAQRRARQAAIHRVIVSAGQHIPDGLKINADGKLETDDQSGIPAWGKALILGGAAAGAFFGAPALLGAFGAGGAEAGAAGAGAAGAGGAGAAGTGAAAGGLLPAAITVPTSTGTIAGLSGGLGTAAGIGAGTGAAGGVLASTATLPTSTGTVAGLSGGGALSAASPALGVLPATQTVPGATAAPVTGLAPSGAVPAASGGSSWLGGVGKFLGSSAGGSAISAGANLAGAAIQSSANTKAAEIAAQTAREALAYEKQRDTYAQQLEASRYGDLTSRLTPYISSGQNANARMAQILGLPAPDTAPMGNPPTPMGQTPAGTAVPRPGGSLVTMQAPDGSIKQIALDQVNHFMARGAKPVGNTYA